MLFAVGKTGSSEHCPAVCVVLGASTGGDFCMRQFKSSEVSRSCDESSLNNSAFDSAKSRRIKFLTSKRFWGISLRENHLERHGRNVSMSSGGLAQNISAYFITNTPQSMSLLWVGTCSQIPSTSLQLSFEVGKDTAHSRFCVCFLLFLHSCHESNRLPSVGHPEDFFRQI